MSTLSETITMIPIPALAILSAAQIARIIRTARESTAATESADRVLAAVRQSRRWT
jgi:hypothetical protein